MNVLVEIGLELHICKKIHAENHKHGQKQNQQTPYVQDFGHRVYECLEATS